MDLQDATMDNGAEWLPELRCWLSAGSGPVPVRRRPCTWLISMALERGYLLWRFTLRAKGEAVWCFLFFNNHRSVHHMRIWFYKILGQPYMCIPRSSAQSCIHQLQTHLFSIPTPNLYPFFPGHCCLSTLILGVLGLSLGFCHLVSLLTLKFFLPTSHYPSAYATFLKPDCR